MTAQLPPQKQMTGMLGLPVAENPIDRMFDAIKRHADDLAARVGRPLELVGMRGVRRSCGRKDAPATFFVL